MIQSLTAGLVSCVLKVLLFLFNTNMNTMKKFLSLFTAVLLTATAFGQDIQLNGTVSAENNQIKNVADPTEDQDAVTKAYVDILLERVNELQNQLSALQSAAGSGTVIDQDGNSYTYLTYGDQVWTVDNAEMVTYRDGTPIPQVTDNTEWANLNTGAWCYYGNDPSKGKLYNWYAVAGIHDNDPNTPNKEFAPEGWHVPNDAEWTSLVNFLINQVPDYDGTTTENKIGKAMASTTGWISSTTTGAIGNDQSLNNSSGFNAFPEGGRYASGTFAHEGKDAVFWSSTESSTIGAWCNSLWYNNNSSIRYSNGQRSGISVRFVRGDVNSNGIDDDNDGYTQNQGDCDDADATIYPGATEILDGIDNDCDGSVDEDLCGNGTIDSGEDCDDGGLNDPASNCYECQYFEDADNDGFNAYFDCNDFDASIYPGAEEIEDGIDNDCDGEIDEGFNASGTVTDQDGNTYDYLTYGDQVWTVENAEMVTYRDGTEIPQVTDGTEWENLTTAAWAYYNNDPTKPRLYNWYAVMGIHDTDPNTPNKEFAPEGWHLPSDAEWTTLEEYLIASGYNYDGTTTGNKIAKAMASNTGWNSSTAMGAPGNDQSLNNSSDFNAFPEGGRGDGGSFFGEGGDAVFWSSTENGADAAWNRTLYNDFSNLLRYYSNGRKGYSVRFVRD
jgi:uncharacterized protein (TIGR02145 family)